MKPQLITQKEAGILDLQTKIIRSYPLQSRQMSVAYMKIKGRHPVGKHVFNHEHDCQFVICVTKGKGMVEFPAESFSVTAGDVVYVPTETPFAVEGNFEYFTVDTPAFYPEQSEEITI